MGHHSRIGWIGAYQIENLSALADILVESSQAENTRQRSKVRMDWLQAKKW